MSCNHRKNALTSALASSIPILGCLGLTPLVASAAETAAQPSVAGEQLETVVVTANRREESIQSVPLAISAVNAESAAQMGITDSQSLAGAVPGLNFQRQANAAIPFLRGVGNPVGESGDEPSVALYIDNVYIPAGSASLLNFNNIDRMEVEKGPQGTLFGRNATGGVVQVFTRNPTQTPELEASVGYANYDTKSGSLYANGSLGSTLAANISLYGSDQTQGWGHDLVTGNKTFTGWDWGGRIKFLWTPSERTSALLAFDIDTTRTQQGLGFHASPGTGTLNPVPPFPNGGIAGPAGYYDTFENLDTFGKDRQEGVSLKITHDGDLARFVSISAWRFTKAVYTLDEDAGPIPLVNVVITTPEKTWTQEFQFLSPASSKLKWIVGAFYMDDLAGFMPLAFSGLAFDPLPGANAFGRLQTKSWSVFGQATQELGADNHVTLGLRYTSDDRTMHAGATYPVDLGGGAIPAGTFVEAANSPQSHTWSKLTWRFGFDHNFTQDVMGYVGYNRGFKSGIFNPVVFPGAPIDPPVSPEVLDAYTLGEKAEFLDHRLRLNTEAFWYKYKNIQVDQIVSGVTHITNAAEATIKGIDLDITAIPVERLTITASLELLDGKYDSFPNGLFNVYNPVVGGNCSFPGTAAQPCPFATPPNYNPGTGTWDLKGNKTIQTPPFSSSVSVSYKVPTGMGPYTFTASWVHTGNYYFDADNGMGQVAPSSQSNDRQPTYDLLNATIGWMSNDGRWAVRLWGKNLTGEKYISFGVEDSFATQYAPAPPRTFGLTATVHL